MKQLEADVVVVGGGAAGLPAAIATAEKGASVIVFEQAAHTGGAANIGNGPFAVESRIQGQRGYTLTREEAFKIHMEYTHWRANARLVSEFYNKSADTIEWLEKMGVEFRELSAHTPGSHYTFHIVKGAREGVKGGPTGAGIHMMRIMTNRAQELGGQVFLKTPVKKVLEEGTRIRRVIAVDEFGEEIQVVTRAVIIAAGGFCDNPEWIKKYTGFEQGREIDVGIIKGVVGDGIHIAWELGAAPTEMTCQLAGFPKIGISHAPFRSVFTVFNQPNLMVNIAGERFMNEEIHIPNPGYSGNAIARQTQRTGFFILDETTTKHYMEIGFDSPGGSFARPTDFDEEFDKAIERGADGIFTANSLEGLADKTGVDKTGLLKTIDEYNQACEIGHDDMFHKSSRFLRPIKQPRFFACKFGVSAYGTLGGIKINWKTEVVNKNNEVIPGLYAAGNDANSIYVDTYIFPLPGNTMGFAINSGRIAGENAAKYVLANIKSKL